MIVELTREEGLRAYHAAHGRHRRARRDGAIGHHSQDVADSPKHNFQGCLGELAVAKALGLPWTSEHTHREQDDDVAGYEVRTADGEKWAAPRCWLYDSDDDDAVFVSAVVRHFPTPEEPRARVAVQGWITGRAARAVVVEGGAPGRRGLYIPNASLWDMQQLLDTVRRA